MNKIKFLFYLISFCTIQSYAQQKEDVQLNFKNAIEYSLESSSNSVNPIIKKINTLLDDGEIDSLSLEEYHNCKATIQANKKFVIGLEEVDDNINLKLKTEKYLESAEKFVDNFILPVIKHLNVPNQAEVFDSEKLTKGLLAIEVLVNKTSELNNSLEEFCLKYELSKNMSDYEREEYTGKIERLKSKLEN